MRPAQLLIVSAALLAACSADRPAASNAVTDGDPTMQLTSTAFQEGADIPSKYTCDDRDISPELAWSGVPEGTRSLALICDDPDAPMGTWVHWVAFNIPVSRTGIAAGEASAALAANGIVEGLTSFGRTGYGGPCPPSGKHRYYFKLVALDTALALDSGATKSSLIAAMEGHILARAQLMGRYSRI